MLDVAEIKELMQALSQYGLSEMKLEQDDFILKLTRGGVILTAAEPSAAQAPPEKLSPLAETMPGTVVCSPIVGTFYACPTPDAEPFVRIGDRVHPGDVLFIIESMKLMNEVTSENEGVVADVCAKNGDPVEYGQPLMRIE